MNASSPAALPKHWIQGFDDAHQRVYYFHKLTRRSTWTKPVDDDDARPPSPAGAPTTSAATPAASSVEWQEVYSPEHERTFYYNRVTRQSVWTDPRAASPASGGRVVLQQVSTAAPALAGASSPLFFTARVGNGVASGSAGGEVPALKAAWSQQTQHHQASGALHGTDPTADWARQQVAGTAGAAASPGDFSSSSGSRLEDELEMYTRDLYRQSQAMNEHTRSWSRQDREDAGSSLMESATSLLKSASLVASGRKRPLEDATTTLAAWGDQPPTVLDVKRAMHGVQAGIEYAKAELKAQAEAKMEAVAVDAEGGFYTILGVATNADAETLKKAFRKGMIKWHPDKVAPEERNLAQEKAHMLQSAYVCLSNPWERFLYDWLGLKRYLYQAKVIQSFKNYMLTGFPVVKHPRKGRPRTRTLWISPDWQYINTAVERILEPSAEEQAMIKGLRIVDIHDVTRGIATEVLQRTAVAKKQSRYFSIVASERTLDIECDTKERCDFLFSRISMLVMDTQQNRRWVERFYEVDALQKARSATTAAKAGKAPSPRPGSTGGPPAEGSNSNKEKPGASNNNGEQSAQREPQRA